MNQTMTRTAMESEKKAKWMKTARWIYWIITILFAGTELLAGIAFLTGARANVQNIVHLGYPLYVMKIIGVFKILGGVAVLQDRSTLFKEWGYVGYALLLVGAAASHIIAGDSFGIDLIPLTLLLLVLISYKQWKTGWM